MSYSRCLECINTTGIIAILRASSSDSLLKAAEALHAGGVLAIEVTLTTPGALEVIREAQQKLSQEIYFGAGSVLDPETTRAAIFAGANFIVAPSLNLDVIKLCRRYSIPVIPGAFTPTEIVTAWEAGADLIKIFPASVGGPEMIKALKAPLPQIDLVPVGGVEISNTASFFRAGAAAVGVGSSLVNDPLLSRGDYDEITSRAKQFIQEAALGRNKL